MSNHEFLCTVPLHVNMANYHLTTAAADTTNGGVGTTVSPQQGRNFCK